MVELRESFHKNTPENGVIDRCLLNGEFSEENLVGYAEACTKVAFSLADKIEQAEKEGSRASIIIPSRGAVPIFIGAMYAFQMMGVSLKTDLSEAEFFSGTVPESDLPSINKKPVDVIVFPLTADINVSDLQEDSRDFSEGMRRFGADVLVDIFLRKPGERDSLEFKLFCSFLKVVEGKQGRVDYLERLPQIRTGIFIDTVISGRASWTVLDEFEQKGVKIGGGRLEPILIIDEQGSKLKSEFRKYIDRCGDSCFRIPKIITEDKGAGLEGLVSVIYPELILEAKREGIYPNGYPLFGIWKEPPPFWNKSRESFKDFLFILDSLIREGKMNSSLEESLLSFVGQLKKCNSSRGEIAARQLKEINSCWDVIRVSETSSRVIQAYFSTRSQKEILKEIKKQLNWQPIRTK